MLEFNTDRSFWMVGAIIVGSVLVILGKTVFKDILSSITDWFKKLITDTTGGGLTGKGTIVSGVIANIDPHVLTTAVTHVLPNVIH